MGRAGGVGMVGGGVGCSWFCETAVVRGVDGGCVFGDGVRVWGCEG